VCKQVGLAPEDLDEMNIGQCLDYIQEWIDNNTDNDESRGQSRKATQADFDNF
jgi:hypothetical protein